MAFAGDEQHGVRWSGAAERMLENRSRNQRHAR